VIDRTQIPAVILIDSQMGENIGASTRAMLNCGLDELRLVRPRNGWPDPAAEAMSVGALDKIQPVQVYETTAAAIADCHFVLATTARTRDMVKPVYTARTASAELVRRAATGQKTAILFGPERTGLDNDDATLAHGLVTIPLNPDFSSLNLGQAVLLLAYEWSQQLIIQPHSKPQKITPDTLPVSHEKLVEMFERLENELESHHFFRTEGQKPTMIRNLRNMLLRAQMTDQEVRTFHGIITALTGNKKSKEE